MSGWLEWFSSLDADAQKRALYGDSSDEIPPEAPEDFQDARECVAELEYRYFHQSRIGVPQP